MSTTENQLLTALKEGPKNIEVLIVETASTAAEVLSALTMLELRRVVRRLPRMVFELADGAAPAFVVTWTAKH
jgi:predicted Rossmann fold nucleotide-binding protein DprA/Smf involved in DNA uptake